MGSIEQKLHRAPATDLIPAGELSRDNEVIAQGSIREYLSDTYLRDYIGDKPDYMASVPVLVEDLLESILSMKLPVSGQTDKLFPVIGVARSTGSVPKCIASGVPRHFWDIGRYYSSILDASELTENSIARQIIAGLSADAAADMDVNLQTFAPLSVVFRQIALKYGVSLDAIQERIVAQKNGRDHKGYTIRFFRPLAPSVEVEMYTGPVPTNLDLETMTISFFDATSGQRLFRIDVGELPLTGPQEEKEKRRGKTSRKQEECYATLEFQDGEVRYGLTGRAEKVMTGADEIWTESENPGDVLEIFVRALRMNLLHEVEDLYDLEMFLPQFTSASLFAMRERIQAFVLRGERIDPGVLGLLMKELALCFTIDPYIAVQALRDSGISFLIPGLANITGEQWEKIIRSRHFVVDAASATEEKRTIPFMHKQRLLYLYGTENLVKPFDGLERFMRALQDIDVVPKETNQWQQYADLWDHWEKSNEQDAQPKPLPPDLRVLTSARGYYLVGRATPTIPSQDEIRQAIELLGRTLRKEIPLSEQITLAREIINRYPGGKNLNSQIKRLEDPSTRMLEDMTRDDIQQELEDLRSQRDSLALLYVLLNRFASGLTPRELKHLYLLPQVSFHKWDNFDELFLELKLLGIVHKRGQKRFDKVGEAVDVSFYSLRRDRSRHGLSNLRLIPGFITQYGFVVTDYFDEVHTNIKNILSRRINMLERVGIANIEALLALTEQDFTIIARTRKPDRETLIKAADSLRLAYDKVRQVHGF